MSSIESFLFNCFSELIESLLMWLILDPRLIAPLDKGLRNEFGVSPLFLIAVMFSTLRLILSIFLSEAVLTLFIVF